MNIIVQNIHMMCNQGGQWTNWETQVSLKFLKKKKKIPKTFQLLTFFIAGIIDEFGCIFQSSVGFCDHPWYRAIHLTGCFHTLQHSSFLYKNQFTRVKIQISRKLKCQFSLCMHIPDIDVPTFDYTRDFILKNHKNGKT